MTKYYFQSGVAIGEISYTEYQKLKDESIELHGQCFLQHSNNAVILLDTKKMTRSFTNFQSKKEHNAAELYDACAQLLNGLLHDDIVEIENGKSCAAEAIANCFTKS